MTKHDIYARFLFQRTYNNIKEYEDVVLYLQLKEVLMDLQYNTGSLNQRKWPSLYQAIQNRDIEGIAQNVHRKDVGLGRNNWAADQIRSIVFW
jgi:hypothetical protein